MFDLRLLGTVDLRRDDGGPVQSIVVQPKRMALLAYLAAADPRGLHRRDTLLALLWPELDADRGRAALSKALHHLRASLGAEAIPGHGDEAVELDRIRVRSDVDRFEEAMDAGRHEDALEAYGGEFLAGFFVSDAPGFEWWVDGERMRLRHRAAEAAAALVDAADHGGDRAAAVGWARRGVALAPLDEPAHRRLIHLLDATGDRAGALEAWARLVASLDEALSVEPSPESRVLAEAIRERGEARVPLERSVAPFTAPEAEAQGAGPAAARTRQPEGKQVDRRPEGGRRPRRIRGGLVLGTLVAALLALAVVVPRGGEPEAGNSVQNSLSFPLQPPFEANRVLVLPLENRTLDPALDPLGRMAADWITDGVSRTGVLEVVPATLGWGTEGPNDPAIWALARETGAGIVVTGSFYREGETLYLQARALDAATGRVIGPVSSVETQVGAAVSGIDLLRTRVLAALAPLADTVYHLRVASPPPTFQTYQAYLEGMQAFVGGDPATALRLYLEAAAADPDWSMPRLAAAIMHLNLGDVAAADTLLASLDAERERLGPLERHTLEFALSMLRADWGAAWVAMDAAARIAPGTINEYMVGEAHRRLNRPTLAIQALEALGPDRGELRGWLPYWRELAWSWGLLGRHDLALEAALEARSRHPRDLLALDLELQARASLGDVDGVQRLVEQRLTSPAGGFPSAGDLMETAANALEARGDEAAAADFRERALAWHDNRPAPERASVSSRLARARLLSQSGRPAEALPLLRTLLQERPDDPVVAARLGIVLARLGEADEARELSRLAGQWMPPVGRSGPLNTLQGAHTFRRAALHAWVGEVDEAVALLLQAQGEGLSFSPRVAEDPDLAPLRTDVGYRAWITPG